jgi:hypothetical protein
VLVEIGSWKGRSTICIAIGSKAGKKNKCYAIDPHTGSSEHKIKGKDIWTFDEFKKNIKEYNVEDLIIPIVKTSEEAAINFEDSVEFIFIDGAHEYDLVKLDFELWFPKLIDGGIIAFHDTKIFGGPKKVVEDYIFKSKYFKGVNFVDSITFATKVKKNFLKDRVKNIFVLFCKNISARSGARVGVKILPQTNVLFISLAFSYLLRARPVKSYNYLRATC